MQFFCLVLTQKKSIDKHIDFRIHLYLHPSKTGLKLVYCYSYYVEASFSMDVYPLPFNRPFFTNIIFGHLSLSSQQHITIQHDFFVYLHATYD